MKIYKGFEGKAGKISYVDFTQIYEEIENFFPRKDFKIAPSKKIDVDGHAYVILKNSIQYMSISTDFPRRQLIDIIKSILKED
ncbi:hypothetical protein KAX02_00430 [candidate division WOR-3 bacterium]|nr:hypothetical protein [candidate division WOR-3 bacterium]